VAQITREPRTRLATNERGKWGDRSFWLICLVAGLGVLAILALILVTTTKEAWPALREAGIGFITDNNWIPNDPDGPSGPRTPEFGALAFVYGTLVVSAVAIFVAVPISIGIALFTTELAPRRMRGGGSPLSLTSWRRSPQSSSDSGQALSSHPTSRPSIRGCTISSMRCPSLGRSSVFRSTVGRAS
jgi:hypothetical protein